MNSPTTFHPPHEPDHQGDELARLTRVRNGVRAVLALGIAASVAANILHAEASIVGRLVAAWPPVALLLAIELLSRVPVHRPWLSALRLTATAAVAGIAAWVSYWHMVSVATEYGENGTSAHLIPVSVDGLVVVASVCLVELADRITTLTTESTTTRDATSTDDAAVVQPHSADEPVSEPAGRITAVAASSARRARPVSRTARAGSAAGSTGEVIARTRARHPEWTTAQIAARVGVTDRTVRRYLNQTDTATAERGEPVTTGPEAMGTAETASGREVAA